MAASCFTRSSSGLSVGVRSLAGPRPICRQPRRAVLVKASDGVRAVEDVLNKASQLLAKVESEVYAGSDSTDGNQTPGLICDESGCSIRIPKDEGTDLSPLLRSMAGSGWSLEVHNSSNSSYKVAVSGADWTVQITPDEWTSLLEAIMSVRNVVRNRLSLGEWHATTQPTAQWRVNNVALTATYGEDDSGKPAFDLTISLAAPAQRTVEVRWPAEAVQSLVSAVEPALASISNS